MDSEKLIRLDRSIPFVKAVFDHIEKGASLDVAVEILHNAELRHGARWIYQWHNGGPFSYFKPVDGKKHFLEDRLKRALKSEILQPEYAVAVEASSTAKPDNFTLFETGELAANEKRLLALISECGLVFDGNSLIQDIFVAYDDGAVQGWTNRSWGHFMAEWANANGWQGKRDWEYSFFAFNAYVMIEQYKDWSRSLLEAMKKNSEYLR